MLLKCEQNMLHMKTHHRCLVMPTSGQTDAIF